MQGILRSVVLVGEEIGGIQNGITQVLECSPVKLVGAALGNDAHLTTGPAPKLGRGYAGLHSKLLYGVCNAEVAERGVDLRVDVADAAEQKTVALGAGSGPVEAPALRSAGRWQAPCRQ